MLADDKKVILFPGHYQYKIEKMIILLLIIIL